MLDINARQVNLLPKDLNLHTVIVVGLGGIGNWVALDLALVGIKQIILIDPDKIELTNLNRTVFKMNQVGEFKTKAMRDLILERRPDTIIMTHEEYLTDRHVEMYKGSYMFDCTDTLGVREFIQPLRENLVDYIKLGYDGFEGTVTHDDFKSGGWGEEENNSYRNVPSFFGTPQVLAGLGIVEVFIKTNMKGESKNINMVEMLDGKIGK